VLAGWSGVLVSGSGEISARELVERFDVGAMAREQVVFSQEESLKLGG
jgi:hypothetical protein